MQSVWQLAFSTLLLSTLATTVVHAKEPPTASDEERAKHHYHLAQTHKELREYEQAAQEFLKAHELYEDPAFFFNAGEMYRLAGNHKLAVKYFKMYLTQHPSGRVAKAAKNTIRELQTKAELQIAREKLAEESARRKALEDKAATAERTREAETAAAARARVQAEEAARREVEAAEAKAKAAVEAAEARLKQAEAKAAPTKEPPTRDQSQDKAVANAQTNGQNDGSWSVEKRLKVAGIATGAVGVLSLGVGAYFGFDAASNNSELSTLKSDRKFDPAFVEARDSSKTTFYVLSGVGAAALITGGVLYYLGDGTSENPEEQAGLSVSPVVTPNGASIACQGSF